MYSIGIALMLHRFSIRFHSLLSLSNYLHHIFLNDISAIFYGLQQSYLNFYWHALQRAHCSDRVFPAFLEPIFENLNP